jgi:hypothetical protein
MIKDRLMAELESWRKSEAFQLFWLRRQRRRTDLNTHAGAAEYVCQVVSKEVNAVLGESNSVESESNGGSSPSNIPEEEPATLSDNNEVDIGTPWMVNDLDVADLFDTYKKEAKQMSDSGLLKIETNIHEILVLTNVLLLSPKQNSALLLEVFSEQSINMLYETLFNEIKANNKDFNEDICIKIARTVNLVEGKKLKKSDGELELLIMARDGLL